MDEDRMRYLIIRQSELDNFVKNIVNFGKAELMTDPLVQKLIALSIRKPRTRKNRTQTTMAAPSESPPIAQKPEEKPKEEVKTEAALPKLPKPYTPPPLEAQGDLSKWFEDRRKKFGEIE
ncbi:MAG: hypothetical protein QXO15_05210 [Nitrososphaerota archaeon]